MSKVKVGLIGAGSMGGLHLKLLKTDPRLREVSDLVAVCDVDDAALKRAEGLGVKRLYRDYREMLEREGLDAVIVATPPHLHREQAVEALRKGLYVLVEKPMGVRLEDALDIARHAGGRVMVAFSLRYHGLYRLVAKYLKEGLGDVVMQWHVALGKVPPTPWVRDPRLSGGMVNENTIHVLYVFYWYAGKVREVFARTWRVRDDVGIEDNALITLTHEGGAASTILHSWSASHRWRKWGLQARNGTVTCEAYLGGPYKVSIRGEVVAEGDFNEPIEEMYVRQLKHFIDCITSGERPETNEEDGVHIHKVIDAIYRSAREGKPVTTQA